MSDTSVHGGRERCFTKILLFCTQKRNRKYDCSQYACPGADGGSDWKTYWAHFSQNLRPEKEAEKTCNQGGRKVEILKQLYMLSDKESD